MKEERKLLGKLIGALGEYKLIIGVLPTGYGKSSIVIEYWNKFKELGRVIHVLPLRAIVEDLTSKAARRGELRELVSYQAHTYIEVDGYSVKKSPFLASKYVITTYDSFLANAVGVPIAELLKSKWHSDLAVALALGATLVLDEVHLLLAPDSSESLEEEVLPRTLAILSNVILKSLRLGSKVIILTATLHPEVLKILLKRLRPKIQEHHNLCYILIYAPENHPYVYTIKQIAGNTCTIEAGIDESFEKLFPHSGFSVKLGCLGVEGVIGEVKALVSLRDKVAVFTNTVHRALEVFQKLSNHIDDRPVLLLHSRMPPESRTKVLQHLRKLDRYVLVATQVIEAGVDISFDAAISSAAPAPSLIQRVGRVCRYAWKENSDCLFIIDKIADGSGSVYDKVWIEESIRYLEIHSQMGEGWRWRLPDQDPSPADYLTLIMTYRFEVQEDRIESYSHKFNKIMDYAVRNPREVIEILDKLGSSFTRASPLLNLVFLNYNLKEKLETNKIIQVPDNLVKSILYSFTIAADLDTVIRACKRGDLCIASEGGDLIFVVKLLLNKQSYLVGVESRLEEIMKEPIKTMHRVICRAIRQVRGILEQEGDLERDIEITSPEILGIMARRECLKEYRVKVHGYELELRSYG